MPISGVPATSAVTASPGRRQAPGQSPQTDIPLPYWNSHAFARLYFLPKSGSSSPELGAAAVCTPRYAYIYLEAESLVRAELLAGDG